MERKIGVIANLIPKRGKTGQKWYSIQSVLEKHFGENIEFFLRNNIVMIVGLLDDIQKKVLKN